MSQRIERAVKERDVVIGGSISLTESLLWSSSMSGMCVLLLQYSHTKINEEFTVRRGQERGNSAALAQRTFLVLRSTDRYVLYYS
jgi:hypothetical protein